MMEWLAWIVPIWFFRAPQSCSRGVQTDWYATVCRHVPNTKSNWSDGRTREFENALSLRIFRPFFDATFLIAVFSNIPESLAINKNRIARIVLESLPSQRYRRQAVRNNLDIVGEFG